jgi:hypothetical protein
LAKAFLPALNVSLEIERQARLPDSPELVLKLSGAGGMMRFAAPAISSFGKLQLGVRMDGDRLFVDLQMMLRQHGQAELLSYARQIEVVTDEGKLVLLVELRVP